MSREQHTVQVMVTMYCRAHHRAVATATAPLGSVALLCADCSALLDYANRRIEVCRFGDTKPACDRCTVHCFRAAEREAIRTVMRYAGPRMVLRHPYLAVRHLLDRHHTAETAA